MNIVIDERIKLEPMQKYQNKNIKLETIETVKQDTKESIKYILNCEAEIIKK